MGDADNSLKYGNYKEQMGRLKKAMANRFLLEALFIEYAVIEDRTESILRHAGVFNPEKHDTLARKLNRISDIARGKAFLKTATNGTVAIRWLYRRRSILRNV